LDFKILETSFVPSSFSFSFVQNLSRKCSNTDVKS